MYKIIKKTGETITIGLICFGLVLISAMAANENNNSNSGSDDCREVVDVPNAWVDGENIGGSDSHTATVCTTCNFDGDGQGGTVIGIGNVNVYVFPNQQLANNFAAHNPGAIVTTNEEIGIESPLSGYDVNQNYAASVDTIWNNILHSGGDFITSNYLTRLYIDYVAQQVGIEATGDAVKAYLAEHGSSGLDLTAQPTGIITNLDTGEVYSITLEEYTNNPDKYAALVKENHARWVINWSAEAANQGTKNKGKLIYDDHGVVDSIICEGDCDDDSGDDDDDDDDDDEGPEKPPVVIPPPPPPKYEMPDYNVDLNLNSCSPPPPVTRTVTTRKKNEHRQDYERMADCETNPTYISKKYEYEPVLVDGNDCGIELEHESIVVINYPSSPSYSPLAVGTTFNWGPITSYVKSTTSVFETYTYESRVITANENIAAHNAYAACLQGNLKKLEEQEKELMKQVEEAKETCEAYYAPLQVAYDACVLACVSSGSSSGSEGESDSDSGDSQSLTDTANAAIDLLTSIMNLIGTATSGSSGNSGSSGSSGSSGNSGSSGSSGGGGGGCGTCVAPPAHDCSSEAEDKAAPYLAEIAQKKEEVNRQIQGASSLLSAQEGEYNELRKCAAKLEYYKSSRYREDNVIKVDKAYMNLSNGYEQVSNTVTGIEKNSGELVIGSRNKDWPTISVQSAPTDGSFERYARFTVPLNTKNGTTGTLRMAIQGATVVTKEQYYDEKAEYPKWNSLVDDSLTEDQLERGYYGYYALLLKYVDNDVADYNFDEFYDAWNQVVTDSIRARESDAEKAAKQREEKMGKCASKAKCWTYLNNSYTKMYGSNSYSWNSSFNIDITGVTSRDVSSEELIDALKEKYGDERAEQMLYGLKSTITYVDDNGIIHHKYNTDDLERLLGGNVNKSYKASDLLSFYRANSSEITTAIYSLVGKNFYDKAVTDEEIDEFNNDVLAGEVMARSRTIVIPSDDTYVCNIKIYDPYFCTDTCEDSNTGNINLVYRSISLKNPFPNANGINKMREMGSNWSEDIANMIITNNRGVKEDKVYSLEPMYTIKLTPTTIQKIQKYNDDNKYDDFNLNCDSNGNYCTSSFLRNFLPSLNAIGDNSCAISLNGASDWYDCYAGGVTE